MGDLGDQWGKAGRVRCWGQRRKGQARGEREGLEMENHYIETFLLRFGCASRVAKKREKEKQSFLGPKTKNLHTKTNLTNNKINLIQENHQIFSL